MTRSKKMPAISKPLFDEESVVRFAAGDLAQNTTGAGPSIRNPPGAPSGNPSEDRLPVTLLLKREVVRRLEEEASRKGKSLDQIVSKLVAKHLDKH
jgi:hypothetical protein